MYLKFLFPNKVLHFSHTMRNVSGINTRKLINTNKNTDGIFPSVNYREFYQWKYSLSIYRGNYGEKKKIKTKQKKYDDMLFIPTKLLSVKSLIRCSLLLDIIHHVN